MDREALVTMWDAWWDGDIWIAPWSRALGGLTAEQAAWSPPLPVGAGEVGAGGRHSIWQNVNHVVFWRTNALNVLAGRAEATAAEIEEGQFARPREVTAGAWEETRRALEASHRGIRAAMADPGNKLDKLDYRLAHDAYHLGQIMYIRALQGLPPVL